jgi:hypothetical protein
MDVSTISHGMKRVEKERSMWLPLWSLVVLFSIIKLIFWFIKIKFIISSFSTLRCLTNEFYGEGWSWEEKESSGDVSPQNKFTVLLFQPLCTYHKFKDIIFYQKNTFESSIEQVAQVPLPRAPTVLKEKCDYFLILSSRLGYNPRRN